jgi:hypothetical protein
MRIEKQNRTQKNWQCKNIMSQAHSRKRSEGQASRAASAAPSTLGQHPGAQADRVLGAGAESQLPGSTNSRDAGRAERCGREQRPGHTGQGWGVQAGSKGVEKEEGWAGKGVR